jgi:hypothetical protein
MLTNIYNAQRKVISVMMEEKAIKPEIVMDYNHHMGYVEKGGRKPNSYSISQHTLKWTKKLFFQLLDLAVLNSCILHSSFRGEKISHRDFRFTVVRNMLAHAGPDWRIPRPLGRSRNVVSQVGRLEVCGLPSVSKKTPRAVSCTSHAFSTCTTS